MTSDKFFILLCIAVTLPIGLFLIDAYFRRKETFVEKLQSKLKGNTDASWK
jgi:hypothetical protein